MAFGPAWLTEVASHTIFKHTDWAVLKSLQMKGCVKHQNMQMLVKLSPLVKLHGALFYGSAPPIYLD